MRLLLTLELPWPPSINTYWRRNGNRYFISEAGEKFRANVVAVVLPMRLARLSCPLTAEIDLYPPDKRTRDLDNHDGKAIFDALFHAGVFENDSLIKRRTGEMLSPTKPGKAVVRLYEYHPSELIVS